MVCSLRRIFPDATNHDGDPASRPRNKNKRTNSADKSPHIAPREPHGGDNTCARAEQ